MLFGGVCVGIGRCFYLHTELLSRRCFSFKQTQILEFAWFDGEGGASRVSSKKAQNYFLDRFERSSTEKLKS